MKTKNLLIAGLLAGPIYVGTSLTEILTRDGFDITRHSWSLLSNGEMGWIHITNFLLTGLLIILGSIGLKRVFKNQTAGIWAPRMLMLYGLGLIAAGIFKADPMDGFPLGTPLGMPTTVSTSGILHLVVGAIGFLGLIATCFILTKRFSSLKDKKWKNFSLFTGLLFFAAFFGIASGSGAGGQVTKFVVIAFIFAVIESFTYLTLLFNKLMKEVK